MNAISICSWSCINVLIPFLLLAENNKEKVKRSKSFLSLSLEGKSYSYLIHTQVWAKKDLPNVNVHKEGF